MCRKRASDGPVARSPPRRLLEERGVPVEPQGVPSPLPAEAGAGRELPEAREEGLLEGELGFHLVAAQAAASPSLPSARAWAQSEMSSARSATAAMLPVSATRTKP